jgi:prophage regulatory protein
MQMPERLLRLPDVLQRTGLSRTSLYRLAAAQRFPKPVKIGLRSSAWRQSEVSEWIQRCTDKSRMAVAWAA